MTTADRLRERGYGGPITVLEAGIQAPYDRPPLSKQLLLGRQSSSEIRLRADDHYVRKSIVLRLGQAVLQFTPESRSVLTDAGEVPYEHLVIASGVVPRMPAAWGALGASTVRTLDESLDVRGRWQEAASCTIIGGGLLGLELAASAVQLGMQVNVVEKESCLLQSVVGSHVGERIAAVHERAGVRLHLGNVVTSLSRDAKQWSTRLSNGHDIESDDLVVSVGSTPNVAWLAGSCLDLTNGVQCDVNGRTALPGVYAVGDVACVASLRGGPPTRVEHWFNALETADATAKAIVEGPSSSTKDVRLSYFWSHQYDHKFQMVGDGAGWDDVECFERPGFKSERAGLFLYFRGGRVVATLAHNWPTVVAHARRLLEVCSSRDKFVELIGTAAGGPAVSATQGDD